MRRVIQTVLVRDGIAVKGRGFSADRPVGSVAQALRVAQARDEVDEVVLLDCTATREGRGPDFDLVEQWTSELRCPIAYGGGIRTLEDVDQIMRCGADKVVIRTAREVIPVAVEKYGAQAVVWSLDLAEPLNLVDGRLSAATMFGVWFSELLRAGEILLQHTRRDGTMEGYDLDLIREVCAAVNVPVIASGGAACYEDFDGALSAGASAVAAGALWLFTDATPREAKVFLRKQGWSVRL